MNPYKNIDKNIGLENNKNSSYYGRFRLNLNQVFPFREPTYNRALIKIKKENIGDVKIIHEHLPEHIYLFNLYKQQDIKNNESIQINCFEDEDYLLEITQLSDVIYLSMENFYFALLELSPYLEDFHFFIYSTGDGDDRWLDEYKNKNGQLYCDRVFCSMEIFYGRIFYYINRVDNQPSDKIFKLFTAWQIYDKLNFLSNREICDKTEKIFISACADDIILNRFFNDLKQIYQLILSEYSKATKDFINWCSLNQV